jgi:hypothetical protein
MVINDNDLANRDKIIMDIQTRQEQIKVLLLDIYQEIKEDKNKCNELIEDFKTHFNTEKKIKLIQLERLRSLLESNDLLNLKNNQDQDNKEESIQLKEDQRDILNEIEKIEKEVAML